MIKVQLEQIVHVPPAAVLDLVMDIERYAERVDRKIRPVLWAHRDGPTVEFACRPTLAGLRQPKVIQYLRLTPGRIDVSLAPRPRNRLAHAMAQFRASFECEPSADGTRVVRTLEFQFRPIARWLLQPLFRRRLEGEVREELRLAKTYLEREVGNDRVP